MIDPKLEGKLGIFAVSLLLLMMTPGLTFGLGRAWDHYLWVPNYEDHTVSKIDVDTHQVVATIPVGQDPLGIAVGFDYIYVPCSNPASLYRIYRNADQVHDIIDLSWIMDFALGVAVDSRGYAFVVGKDDVPPDPGPGYLVKVNPQGVVERSKVVATIDHTPKEIGIGLNGLGDGFVPWTQAWWCKTGIVHFSTDDLSHADYTLSYLYYRAPGVGIDKEGNGWTAGHRGGTSSITKSISGQGLTNYIIPQPEPWDGKFGDILVDPQQSVWLGTNLGLFRLIPDTEQWDLFEVGETQGGVALDRNGYMWCSFPEENQLKKFNLDGNQVGPAVNVGSCPYGYGDMTGYECISICEDLDEDGYISDNPSCMGDDCDDWNPGIYPGAEEICDGEDSDCNGVLPEEEADVDGDKWIPCMGDCDDSDSTVYPGAEEICDGKDTDCDGVGPEEEVDEDGDGHMICEGDCDDTDPDVNPDAVEGAIDDPTCSDGIDNDCDGLIDTDPECISFLVPDEQSTIQDAIDVSESGNTILVSPGIYRENIDFMGKDIEVHSLDGPMKTIIDGGRDGSAVSFTSGEKKDAVLDGFTIQNGSGMFITLPFLGAGFYCGGGILCGFSAPTITNCMITNNYAYLGGGIYLRDSTPTITNCMIVRNRATGLIHGGGGLYLEDSSPTITNSTVGSNYAGQYAGGIFCWSSSPTITNSILWGDFSIYDSEIHVRSGTPVVTYSDVEGGWSGEGNIDTNPSFVGGVSFHLRPGSPCVDSGTDAGVYTDLDSQRRPWGAGFDMGADEFSAEPCSVIASSGGQFFTLYLIPILTFVFFSRRRITSKSPAPTISVD